MRYMRQVVMVCVEEGSVVAQQADRSGLLRSDQQALFQLQNTHTHTHY